VEADGLSFFLPRTPATAENNMANNIAEVLKKKAAAKI